MVDLFAPHGITIEVLYQAGTNELVGGKGLSQFCCIGEVGAVELGARSPHLWQAGRAHWGAACSARLVVGQPTRLPSEDSTHTYTQAETAAWAWGCGVGLWRGAVRRTLESCDSLKLTLLKSPSAMSAPEMSKVLASLPDILHSRKSYSLSRAALAWPIADESKRQRFVSARSMGGNLNFSVCARKETSARRG